MDTFSRKFVFHRHGFHNEIVYTNKTKQKKEQERIPVGWVTPAS